MIDWRIKYYMPNLYSKLHNFNINMPVINKEIALIKKSNKCSTLQALEIYREKLKEN